MTIACFLRALSALALGVFLTGCAVDGADFTAGSRVPVECAEPLELPAVTLTGIRDGSACAYKGIPFAKAPIGGLRFKPPQPLEGHQGTLTADVFGRDCVQTPVFQDVPVGENCLYLNVWTPGETADGKLQSDLPVMVFFYGGGFVAGGGSWAFYNGESFTKHDVILVTVNYRLGPLGYLAPSAVTDTDGAPLEGNLGLRDQIASLKWVQANIAGFGGDAGRVTIFGESAGAWSTCDVMASTEAEGLFHRAIMQSGECNVGSRSEIAAKADAWIAKTGCPATGPEALACLRALDAADLPGKYPYSMGGGNYPNVDGSLLPDQPIRRLRAGAARKIPLIAGYNREETNALRHFPDHSHLVQQGFPAFWAKLGLSLTAAQIERLREAYGTMEFSDPMAYATAMLNDIVFVCPAQDAVAAQVSQHAPAWHYRFSVGESEMALENYLGTFHGLEIPYVFGNTSGFSFLYDSAGWSRMHAMTERIQRYWTRFAATGDPNGGDDPYWPGFAEAHSRLELTIELAVTQGESDTRCALWAELAPVPLGERFDFIKQVVGFNPIE